MSKHMVTVGYAKTVETALGVWSEEFTEKTYVGNLLRLSRSLQASQQSINDNVVISNQLSIVADAFAYENFFGIRYVTLFNSKWKVTSVEVQRPRLVLTLGSVYND